MQLAQLINLRGEREREKEEKRKRKRRKERRRKKKEEGEESKEKKGRKNIQLSLLPLCVVVLLPCSERIIYVSVASV